MSIPGKVLIALLAALAVSAVAEMAFQYLTLQQLLVPTAAASLLAVLLSHHPLPMPTGLGGGAAVDKQATDAPRAASSSKAASNAERETGSVKWFNSTKGFGFIIRDGGEEIFVHHRSIRGDGRRSLSDGEAVSFRVAQTEKGPQAEDVETEG